MAHSPAALCPLPRLSARKPRRVGHRVTRHDGGAAQDPAAVHRRSAFEAAHPAGEDAASSRCRAGCRGLALVAAAAARRQRLQKMDATAGEQWQQGPRRAAEAERWSLDAPPPAAPFQSLRRPRRRHRGSRPHTPPTRIFYVRLG